MISAWSYGGETSTTSIPARRSSVASRRTARSASRAVIPPGSGVPVPGREGRIAHVDVEGQEHVVPRLGDGDDVVHHRVHAPFADLLHQVPAKALLPRPREVLGVRPVAAQPDLQDVLAPQRPLLDQEAHRRPVRAGPRPTTLGALSACASKWIRPSAAGLGRWAATAPTSGWAIEWSPPRTMGMAPAAQISPTVLRRAPWLPAGSAGVTSASP